jgi:hypothetical protein
VLCCSKSTEGARSSAGEGRQSPARILMGKGDPLTDRQGSAGTARGDATVGRDGRHTCGHLQRSIAMQSCPRW